MESCYDVAMVAPLRVEEAMLSHLSPGTPSVRAYDHTSYERRPEIDAHPSLSSPHGVAVTL